MMITLYQQILNLFRSFGSILKVLVISKFYISFPQTRFRKQVIILGTGPSLAETLLKNLTVLKDNDTIGLNHFAEKEEFIILQPKYYVIGAPELWLENLNDYYTQKSIKLFSVINDKTDWPLTLFIGIDGRSSARLKLISENKNITISYYNRTPIEGNESIRRLLYNCNLGMPRPHNVLIPSIMISIWMGYKQIYLVGADHSWHESLRILDDNTVQLAQKHYFDIKEHWNTMKYSGKRDRKMHEIFEKWMLSFRGYFDIKKYATKKNIKIWNASYKSYIDAFDRVDLNEQFGS